MVSSFQWVTACFLTVRNCPDWWSPCPCRPAGRTKGKPGLGHWVQGVVPILATQRGVFGIRLLRRPAGTSTITRGPKSRRALHIRFTALLSPS